MRFECLLEPDLRFGFRGQNPAHTGGVNMKDIPGLKKFAKGEELLLPPEWPPMPHDVISIFGFTLVEFRDHKVWKACTESDYRNVLLALGVQDEKIAELIKLKTGEKALGLCLSVNNRCQGSCPTQYGECAGVVYGSTVTCYCMI
jgi:hypothetical protein